MTTYLDCWIKVAAALFSQALAGEPQLEESLPRPLSGGSFGFAATIGGDESGRFSILLDGSVLNSPLVGEGVDQRAGWAELLREVCDAAVGELYAQTGHKCRIDRFEPVESEPKISHAFQLHSGDHAWTLLVRDDVRVPKAAPSPAAEGVGSGRPAPPPLSPAAAPALAAGLELLLDVELDASLRFGCREMPLGEILDLGPGDVVQLDRHVADPVDLIVGDKIVARGEVVLINGNFGLRVTEVASPKRRLESIRCLF